MGSRGPSNGIGASVKFDNTGMFMYNRNLQAREVIDGLTNTMFVGETINGHEIPTSNRWSAATRHLDTMRSTDNPINTVPLRDGDPRGYLNLYGYKTYGCFASLHGNGAQFGFGDGHVEYLVDSIGFQIYQALSTRDQGEVVDGY